MEVTFVVQSEKDAVLSQWNVSNWFNGIDKKNDNIAWIHALKSMHAIDWWWKHENISKILKYKHVEKLLNKNCGKHLEFSSKTTLKAYRDLFRNLSSI